MFKNIIFIFLSYSLLWYILSGSGNYFILTLGIVTAFLSVIYTEIDFSRKKVSKLTFYSIYLLKEICKSTCNVLKEIYRFPLGYNSGYREFKTNIKVDSHKVIFANSITLTPGTITVQLDDDKLLVHALNKEELDSLPGSKMEKRIISFDKWNKIRKKGKLV